MLKLVGTGRNKMEIKKYKFCRKPLKNGHQKFCNSTCRVEYKRIRNNCIARLKKTCSYDKCHKLARCLIHGQFTCVEHFKRIKLEEKFKIFKVCVNCGTPFPTSKLVIGKKFCNKLCKEEFRERKQEESSDVK